MGSNSFFSNLFHSSIHGRALVVLAVLAWSNVAFCGEIHDAARSGDLEKIKALVKSNPELAFSKDDKGETPLYWAAAWGHKDAAEFLLANKADVNVKDSDGYTPLHAAAQGGDKNLTELLLANKADVNAKTAVNAANSQAWTPLDMAVFMKHNKNVARLLRQHGGNSTIVPEGMVHFDQALGSGSTLAAIGGNNGVQILGGPAAHLLIDDYIDKLDEIHHAARNGELEKVKALVKDHAEMVFSKDDEGQTPLFSAAIGGHKEVVELLLANKADVNAKDDNGQTPLLVTAKAGKHDMVELLRQHGGQ